MTQWQPWVSLLVKRHIYQSLMKTSHLSAVCCSCNCTSLKVANMPVLPPVASGRLTNTPKWTGHLRLRATTRIIRKDKNKTQKYQRHWSTFAAHCGPRWQWATWLPKSAERLWAIKPWILNILHQSLLGQLYIGPKLINNLQAVLAAHTRLGLFALGSVSKSLSLWEQCYKPMVTAHLTSTRWIITCLNYPN